MYDAADRPCAADAAVRRHWFIVEAAPAPDLLVRVLTPFAVQSADLAAVAVTRDGGRVAIRIETDGLDPTRAETLRRRLAAMPATLAVGMGWREPGPAT